MKDLKVIFIKDVQGVFEGIKRFPVTVINLWALAIIIFIQIGRTESLPLMFEKLCYTFFIGAIIGMATQFIFERFKDGLGKRAVVYGVAILVLIGYYILLLPATEMWWFITVRSWVVALALGCMMLWVPSYRTNIDFNRTTLAHFKACFTAILYAVVMSLGCVAIIGAIDTLLFNVDNDIYSYMLTTIWVLFAPLYYLSLLPKFSEGEETDYPKFLDILISKIAIPLLSIYTLVLVAYFLKILFKRSWPSGQIGPMVLIYVIAGILIFVLSSLLENKFTVFYRKFFPKMLIPIVVMQIISVSIRLKNYGVTESRYYIFIFGIVSLTIGFGLSFRKTLRNEWIALFVGVFVLGSIIPPMDAFTISRNSQVKRIETILEDEGMLVDNKIIKKKDASDYTKSQVTSILNYLQDKGYTGTIKWLPKDFSTYNHMNTIFGFEPTYDYAGGDRWYFNMCLNEKDPLPIGGYEVLLKTYISRYEDVEKTSFNLKGETYNLKASKLADDEVYLSILDSEGAEVIGTKLDIFVDTLMNKDSKKKEASAEELSFEVEKNGYKMKVIFQNIDYSFTGETVLDFSYDAYVMFANGKDK